MANNSGNGATNPTSTDQYFGSLPTEEIAAALQQKCDDYYTYISSSNLAELWRRAYRAYYGMRNGNFSAGWGLFDTGRLIASGDQGEIVRIKVNHFSNLIQHQLSLITGSRPSLDCRATNSDAESLIAADLGDGVIDYMFREKKLERNYYRAVETALVLSEGYVVMGWDPKAGEEYGVGPNGAPLMNGDVVCKNFNPFQVIKEIKKQSDEQENWYITHGRVNRYDLIAKYAADDPELAAKIMSAGSDDTSYTNRTYSDPSQIIASNCQADIQTDDVPFMEFYHKPTPAVPTGRYTIFVDGETLLFDGPLPFRDVPVYRVTPRDIINTPYGWTPSFDILALQELLDKLYTCVSTNTLGNGINNFWTPPDAGLEVVQLGGGRNLIESVVKPEVLQLLSTPAEVYSYIDKVESVMQKLMGVSDVNRGEVPSADMSGTAMAFMASQAITFNSATQASANQLLEQMGTGCINILKDYASTPRLAVIVGIQNRPQLKMFTGQDLEPINNVVCDATSALSKTLTGKIAIADNLLATPGMIKTPQEYLTLIKTGEMEPMTRSPLSTNFLIQKENEWMLEGKDPNVIRTDAHAQHIAEHLTLLDSPEAREDAGLVERVLRHVGLHENEQLVMQAMHPAILQAQGNGPLAAPGIPDPQPLQGAEQVPQDMPQLFNAQMGVQEPRPAQQPRLPKGADQQTQDSYMQLQQQIGA